jgi:hypothetical protein
LSPRRRSWWSGISYDEELLGEASLVPRPGALREERRAAIIERGESVGSVDLTLEEVEVP